MIFRWEQKGNLRRLALLRTPWFRVFIHHVEVADRDRHLHNHPWEWARSLVLSGGYTELRREHVRGVPEVRGRSYDPGNWIKWSHRTLHRIVAVHPHTYTLFIAGPRSPDGWGFRTPSGYVDARDYFESRGETIK